MSCAYKKRKKSIARGTWSFELQTQRDNIMDGVLPPRFFRHLTDQERRDEPQGLLSDSVKKRSRRRYRVRRPADNRTGVERLLASLR